MVDILDSSCVQVPGAAGRGPDRQPGGHGALLRGGRKQQPDEGDQGAGGQALR